MISPVPGPRAISVGAISLGCPKNLVDTEVMLGLLREAGFALVPEEAGPEVLLVNTCCFVAAARQEAAAALEKAAARRRAGEVKALVCAGCWPQADLAHLRQRFPEVDAFMGPGDVANIVSIVSGALAGSGQPGPAAPPSSFLYDDHLPRVLATPPWTAYIKIAEGCSRGCRFCVIPRLRGPQRSRPPDSILREARALAAAGVREVNLVAQDTTAYGSDRGGPGLADLLGELAAVDGLHWVRLLYGFPDRVDDRLIDVMARHARICHYIDLPFQHADPEILRRMGRPGDGAAYLRLIERLRAAMPDIAIRSTLLVGFPGEHEEHFRRLLEFVEAAGLDRAGAFQYSPEQGTPAAAMPDRPPPEVAAERYHRVMTLQQRISLARNRLWVGREIEVLIEAAGPVPGEWIGRSFRDAPEVDGTVRVIGPRRGLRGGDLVLVRVTGAEPYDLIAEPVASTRARRPAGRGRAPDRPQ